MQDTVTFQKPVLVAEKGAHSFTLLDVPVFEAPIRHGKSATIDFSQDCSGQLYEFASSFLKRASVYFSKPLPIEIFIQRLRHTWTTNEFSADELSFIGKQEARILLKWIPATIYFYRNYYEIEWQLIEILPLPLSGGGTEERPVAAAAAAAATHDKEEQGEKEERSVEIPPPSTQPIPPSGLQEIVEESNSIPFHQSSKAPPSSPRSTRQHLKQKVRKARLRAALAQLRAEKLAERYYIRYGDLDLENESGASSDSDLSFEDGLS